jgi:hypothetical protein
MIPYVVLYICVVFLTLPLKQTRSCLEIRMQDEVSEGVSE